MIHDIGNNEFRLKRGSGQTLHTQIKEGLIREFSGYALNTKLPTDRALAKTLDVSPVTVNKVMNELEREGYVVRRQGRGTFLASREKQVVRESSGSGVNGQIVIALPNYFSSEYWQRLHCAEELAVRNGYELIEFKFNPDTTWDSVFSLIEKQPNLQGVIVSPLADSFTREVYDRFDKLGVPVTVFGNFPFITLGENITAITTDWFKLNYLKIKYLLDRGHRNIASVRNEPGGFDNNMGIKGQKQAFLDCGLNPRELIISLEGAGLWKNSAEAGYLQTKKIMESNNITALNYDSTAGAMGGLRCIWEKGLRVPEDISIIATGGYLNYENFMPPPLTVVHPDIPSELSSVFEVIMEKNARYPKLLMSEPVLVERMSVKDISADIPVK